MADPDDLGKVGAIMYERGIYVTLAFYPGVPRDQVGFRLQLTAANTDEEVDELVEVLEELADSDLLRLRED
jgi:8-amino-7-oxononanoate synthase